MVRILLVDDHKLFREGLHALLNAIDDFEIVGEAKDGQEAVEKVQSLNPDIVVMDIEMPGMSGIDAARKIIAINGKIKILALSRHNERQYVSDMFMVGAVGYILKDTAVNELVSAIRTVVDGKRYCSPELIGVVLDDYSDRLVSEQKSPARLLSPRELEVLKLLADGFSSKEIGAQLNVSAKTVDTHKMRIMKKLNLHTLADLIKFAIRENLVKI